MNIPPAPLSDKPRKVMISYSRDGAPHEAWVRNLADRLMDNGIDALVDQYELRPGMVLSHFMEKAVDSVDKVLLVMTPPFKAKADGRKGGAGYETSMIAQEFLENQSSEKFIPILRRGDPSTAIPKFLKSVLYVDMTDDARFEEDFTTLRHAIHDRSIHVKPTLGKPGLFRSADEVPGYPKPPEPQSLGQTSPAYPLGLDQSGELSDANELLAFYNMPYFSKWIFRLEVPAMANRSLLAFYNHLHSNVVTGDSPAYFFPWILNDQRKIAHHPAFLFEFKDEVKNINNYFTQERLKIDKGLIVYEFSEYTSTNPIPVGTTQPFLSLLYLLTILRKIREKTKADIWAKLSVTFRSNHLARLNFGNTPVVFPAKYRNQIMIVPDNLAVREVPFTDFTPDSLYGVFQEIYSIFSAENPKSPLPFVELDRPGFDHLLKHLHQGLF